MDLLISYTLFMYGDLTSLDREKRIQIRFLFTQFCRRQITPEQARQHPQKNLITRALGAESRLRADLFRQPMEPGDALLLCSDGLSNVVSDQELLYEVLHGGPAEDCCRRLLDITLSRGAPDNVTAVLLQM